MAIKRSDWNMYAENSKREAPESLKLRKTISQLVGEASSKANGEVVERVLNYEYPMTWGQAKILERHNAQVYFTEKGTGKIYQQLACPSGKHEIIKHYCKPQEGMS